MEISYQYIRQLYLEKLTDTISEDDDARLETLLHENSEALSIWRRLEDENGELNADAVLARIDPKNELEVWKSRIGNGHKPVRHRFLRRWPAAAAIVAGLGIGYLFLGNFDRVPLLAPVSGNHDSTRIGGVKLVLGDGKSIVFSKNKAQQFAIDGMELKNSGNQLVYEGIEEQPAILNKLIVPAREDYNITLSDGTRVSLNSESTLHFPFHFTGDTREIYIEGEAYLEVAKDSKHPFVVHTALANIHVTGTSFNVNTYEKGTLRTSLVEGSISLLAVGKKPLNLVAGVEAIYAKEAGFTTTPFDPGEVLSWREGVFYFHNSELGELTDLISRWFGVQVVFDRKNLAHHTVSGLLEKGHLTEFLNDLRKTSGIDYSLKDKVLYLK